jgi:hypothetical protein
MNRYTIGYMEGYMMNGNTMEDGVNISEDDSNIDIDKMNMEEAGSNEITQPNKRAFLVALSETGNITGASKITGIARKTHYNWMQEDPAYAAAYKVALEQAAENLESEARRRATKGTAKPVFYKGEECGTVQEYSDTLLIFLLKGAMPDKYSERFQGTMDVNVTVEDKTPQERRARIADLLSKKQIAGAIDLDPAEE